MYQDPQPKKRKILILMVAIIPLLIIIIVSIIGLTLSNIGKDPIISINNLIDCANGLSTEDKYDVERVYYSILEKQLELDARETPKQKVIDGKVRQDSCRIETTVIETKNTIYTAYFILDIESVSYSFGARFSYFKPDDYPSKHVDLGSPALYCLDNTDLIYGDFRCKSNPLIEHYGDLNDINRILPYSDSENHFFIQLIASTDSKNGKAILITYMPGLEVYQRGDIEDYRQKYRKIIEDWLKKHSVNLSEYQVIEKWN